jgi:LacI family transcriptional regulator
MEPDRSMTHSKPPTGHDVAAAAGVSQPTVSRALRGDPRLSAETRRRVQKAAEALHYVPSTRGRSLATRSAGQIGIVVSDLGNPFYFEILDAVHEALREAETRMLVLTPDADGNVPLSRLVDGSLDGVILTTTQLGSSLPGEMAERGFPFVLLNREVDDAPGDVCVADNAGGAGLVAKELLNLGHREIAAIFGPETTSTGRDRERGFRDVLGASGIALGANRWRRGPFDFAVGRKLARTLLAADPSPPTAVFCANDILALGAIDEFSAHGIRIPQELTVIGFDDVAMASWRAFQLTTVSQNIYRMVRISTDLLLRRIEARAEDEPEPEPERVVLAPQIVYRGTHGPPRR